MNPVWVGRFEVKGPRDHKFMNGYGAAFLWMAAHARDAEHLRERVEQTMRADGFEVIKADDIHPVADGARLPQEVRRVLSESRRNSDTVMRGPFHGFEPQGQRPPAMLQLKTERLLLRPWQKRDREPFAAMNADRRVMQFFVGPMTRRQSDEAVDRYLAAFEQDGFSFMVAELRETGAFAGVIGLQVMRDVVPNLQQPAVEVGWRLALEHQGKGLATEGGREVINLAFNHFFLDEVVAITAVANKASRRVMEKLGMKHRAEQDFDHPRMPPNHLYARHTLYQLHNPKPHQPPVIPAHIRVMRVRDPGKETR
jgi:RimJ/RimL family protein N-acetyltransferase